MPRLDEAAGRFREAVTAGSAGEAQRFLVEYCRAVNESRPGMEALGGAIDLLHWADRLVRAQRAHAAMELTRGSSRRCYHVATQSAGTLHVEG